MYKPTDTGASESFSIFQNAATFFANKTGLVEMDQ